MILTRQLLSLARNDKRMSGAWLLAVGSATKGNEALGTNRQESAVLRTIGRRTLEQAVEGA